MKQKIGSALLFLATVAAAGLVFAMLLGSANPVCAI